MAQLPSSILLLAHVSLPAMGFNFSFGRPGQCDPLSLSWSGGQPPFQLLIIPPGGTMRNVSIPTSAYNSGSRQGSYTLSQLDLAQEQQFLLSMSDTSGIFAGGTSSLLTVGVPQNGKNCNTTFPSPDFYFSLDSDLAQCSPFPVTLYPGAVVPTLPVRLLVNVPQGQSFVVNLKPGLSPWIANLTAGTPAVFTTLDAKDSNGGTKVLRVAKPTNNTFCLLSSTTSAGPSSTTFGGKATALDVETQHTHTSITGLAVSISIGGFGILCIALAFFCYYRRRQLHAKRSRTVLDLTAGLDDPDSSYQMINLRRPPNARSTRETMVSEGYGSHSKPTPRSFRPVQSQEPAGVSVYTPRTAGITRNYTSDIIVHRGVTESAGNPIEFPPQ